MFELCGPTVELGGQNGVFLASVLPGHAGLVPGSKMACVALVLDVS